MDGNKKRFDKDLYDQNNDRAIAAVLQYIHSNGLHGALNDDLYGPDIVVYNGYRKASYVEVEIKSHWKGGEFPFDTVQLPERKGKFLKLRHSIEYWILSSDCKQAIVIPESSVTKGRLKEVRNVLVEAGEMFFQIPTSECHIIDLTDSPDGE